jgi:hypothetical protein
MIDSDKKYPNPRPSQHVHCDHDVTFGIWGSCVRTTEFLNSLIWPIVALIYLTPLLSGVIYRPGLYKCKKLNNSSDHQGHRGRDDRKCEIKCPNPRSSQHVFSDHDVMSESGGSWERTTTAFHYPSDQSCDEGNLQDRPVVLTHNFGRVPVVMSAFDFGDFWPFNWLLLY